MVETNPKELVFLRVIDTRIAKIDRLVNNCEPASLDVIQSTVKLLGDWKQKGHITQDSVDTLSDRLFDSLDRYKDDCSLD